MPLPLIPILLGGASAIAAGHGIKKGLEAKSDMDLAKSINSDAQSIARRAEKSIQSTKDETTKAIEGLGEKKISVLSGSINDFVSTFEKIRNIDFRSSEGLEELKYFNPQSPEFLQLKKVSVEAKQIAVNMSVSGSVGSLAANATTAWFACSVFGVGSAGATVLGGLLGGPVALALGGSLLAKQADKAYWDAKSNLEKAEAFEEQAKSINAMLSAIGIRANQLKQLLTDLDKPFSKLVADMGSIVINHGTDWANYPEADRKQIYKCVQVAQTVKMVLDTSLLNEDGSLREESQKSLTDGAKFLDSLSI